MCEKCDEIDKTIERYRMLAARVLDPLTTDEIQKLVAEMEADKAALHPA